MLMTGLVSILSVEDLGISNNASKSSYIVVFVKEFGNEENTFRVTAFGSNAEYIARNLVTMNNTPYVGETGIAGYCQLHSKEERKANKVKIHARRVQISGALDISYSERDVSGTKIVPIKGIEKKLAFTIQAEVQSTRIIANSIQFIDAKSTKTGADVIVEIDSEIDYEALADNIVEENLNATTGTGSEDKEVIIEVNANGPIIGKDFKGR